MQSSLVPRKVVPITCKLMSLSLSATPLLNPHLSLLPSLGHSQVFPCMARMIKASPSGDFTPHHSSLRGKNLEHATKTHTICPSATATVLHLGFVRALDEHRGVSSAAGKGDLEVSVLVLSQGL